MRKWRSSTRWSLKAAVSAYKKNLKMSSCISVLDFKQAALQNFSFVLVFTEIPVLHFAKACISITAKKMPNGTEAGMSFPLNTSLDFEKIWLGAMEKHSSLHTILKSHVFYLKIWRHPTGSRILETITAEKIKCFGEINKSKVQGSLSLPTFLLN